MPQGGAPQQQVEPAFVPTENGWNKPVENPDGKQPKDGDPQIVEGGDKTANQKYRGHIQGLHDSKAEGSNDPLLDFTFMGDGKPGDNTPDGKTDSDKGPPKEPDLSESSGRSEQRTTDQTFSQEYGEDSQQSEKKENSEKEPTEPDTGDGEDRPDNPDDKPDEGKEKTLDQKLEDAKQRAAEEGKPLVIIFGSQNALDTEKLTKDTIAENMKSNDAIYMYVDTDNLDPNSELGQVARRSEENGRGLGPDGKPDGRDMVFTGIYNVDKSADGSLSIGKSTATFWGGRKAISGIMKEQMEYAKRSTYKANGPGGDGGDGGRSGPPRRPDIDSDDGSPDRRPEDNPDSRPDDEKKDNDADGDRDREKDDADEREQREKREKELEEKKKKFEFDQTQLQEALKNAHETGRELVIKIGADWCGPCGAINEDVFGKENPFNPNADKNELASTKSDTESQLRDGNILIHMDGTDPRDGKRIDEAFGLKSFPTTIKGKAVPDGKGGFKFEETDRLEGYGDPNVKEKQSREEQEKYYRQWLGIK